MIFTYFVIGGFIGALIGLFAALIFGLDELAGSTAGYITGAILAPLINWSDRREFKHELRDRESVRRPGETHQEWVERSMGSTQDSER